MRKLLLALFCILVTLPSFAVEFTYTYAGQTLKYFTVGTDKCGVGKNSDISGLVSIPEKVTYNGTEYKVTVLGQSAFSQCSNLTSITIPNSVTSIGEFVFAQSGLKSITIPNSVTSIGSYAFSHCSNLTSITIPNSIKSMGTYTFWNCSSLTSIALSNSATSIGDKMFEGCKNLQSIIIPNSVTSIGISAFQECNRLTSVTIPNSVTSIGDHAFYDCSSLKSITLSSAITSIKDYSFYGCKNLKSLTIPNTVKSIGLKAFSDCSSLESITIPNSVTSIGAYAFPGCSRLASVTISNAVTSLENYTFANCTNLQSLTIPNSVKSIGTSAFSDCSSLKTITLGSGLTYLSPTTFKNCYDLTEVTSLTMTPPLVNTSENKFALTECNLYVPKGSEEAYRNAYWWNEFASINKEIKHSISLQVSGGGVLKCNGIATPAVSVLDGSTAIISIIPDSGCILERFLVNNVDVTNNVANNQYRIENVKSNHVVKAEFVDRPINLTIKYPGIGTAVHTLAKGTQFTTNFVTENGWVLSSALWNGQDITTKFSNGGKFTTPVLNADAQLYLVLKKGNAAMESVLNDVVKVTAYNGVINVIGAETGTRVSVKDIKGIVVANAKITDATQTIPVNKSGVFIVNVDDATYKVAL